MRARCWIVSVVAVLPIFAAAQSVSPPPKPLHLVGEHWTPYNPPTEFPEGSTVHVIEKGDTLWDLARAHLGDPYLWPQLWERNPYILDSHWIYPGDPVLIDVAVQGAEAPVEEAVVPEEGTVVSEWGEEPFEEEELGEGTWETAPEAEVVPYPLGSSADVYCFAKLVDDPSIFPFEINSAERMQYQDHFSEGDIVYVNGGAEQGVRPGDRFFVLHELRKLRHPISRADMGTIYSQVGQLKVLCAQEETAIAEITLACDPVSIGDVLLPFRPIPVPLVIAPEPSDRCDLPNGKPTGYIIYQRDDVIDSGAENLVFIDLGQAEGLYPGQFATIFRDNPVQGMPRLVVGELGVLTVDETYSTAKISRGWAPVGLGDRIELK
jgi:hypothetical protein